MNNQTLNEAQYEFLSRYLDLLQTVEEGMDYVFTHYGQEDVQKGDQMLADMMEALAAFTDANVTMTSIFVQNQEVLDRMRDFDQLIEDVRQLEQRYHSVEERWDFVRNQLVPGFREWKQSIERTLQKFHQQ